MISVDELWALLESAVAPLPARALPLAEATGLTLAEPVLADADEPAFDRSAMDGFAIREEAAAGEFCIVGRVLPGEPAPAAPGEREAWRVYTGAALPPGVRVIKQEEARVSETSVVISGTAGPLHVRRRGSAARRGEVLLPAGLALTPAALAVAAGAGVVRPVVIPRPRVVHLTTGREIIPPGGTPRPGQIRDTNGTLIAALVREAGAELAASGHADEAVHACLDAVRRMGESTADLLLISGGSSIGDYDGTAALLGQLGFSLHCKAVNCRPGKPLLAGFRGRQVAFGIPGNPVSHFVAFQLFIRPVIEALLGRARQPLARARLNRGAAIDPNPRETFWPARASIADGALGVTPVPWLDSGQLSALSGVNALIRIPAAAPLPCVGGIVEFVPCGLPLHTDLP